MTIVKSSAHRRLTSHLKFQPSLANVWLFVVANHVQLILWKKFFRSIVLKSLCYHHQIVDITPKLNKGPGTRTVLTTYGLNLKNTGICSCAKIKTKKRSFRECALDRDTFDQRGHMCSDTQRDPTKTMMIAISKSHTIARSIWKRLPFRKQGHSCG